MTTFYPVSGQVINSEHEKLEVRLIPSGLFKGQFTLDTHDDYPSKAVACHLLDQQTLEFLFKHLGFQERVEVIRKSDLQRIEELRQRIAELEKQVSNESWRSSQTSQRSGWGL